MTSLRDRYSLHVDVTGITIEAIRNMLLGILPPTEFIPTLVRAGIPEEAARRLTGDLNREVFIPLREQVRKDPSAVPAHATNSSVPLVGPPEIRQPEKFLPEPVTQQAPSAPKIPPYNIINAEVRPAVRTMASDMEMLKEGKLPGYQQPVSPRPLTHTLQPEHATPARSFQTASIPVALTAPQTQQLPSEPLIPVLKPLENVTYSVKAPSTADPYREPIEL